MGKSLGNESPLTSTPSVELTLGSWTVLIEEVGREAPWRKATMLMTKTATSWRHWLPVLTDLVSAF